MIPAHLSRELICEGNSDWAGITEPWLRAALEGLVAYGSGQGAFGSSFAVDESDPYAWAQRLREIPDKDALQELGYLGYLGTDGSSSGSGNGRSNGKFAFTKGTGAGGQRGSKRTGSGRNGAAGAKGRAR